ncbi:MAG: hypothetical protein GWP59_04680 [Chlamydiales bacterium]|nr:hypothetical protein [Chlamydiales bacterium]NCF70980.1 hypothetical protein [Chlamydiales bacterium]
MSTALGFKQFAPVVLTEGILDSHAVGALSRAGLTSDVIPRTFFASRVSPTNTEVSDSSLSSTSSDSSIKSILKTKGLKKKAKPRRVTISPTSSCGYVDLATKKVGVVPLRTSFIENVSRESSLAQARDPEDVKEVKHIIKHMAGEDD